MIPLASTLEQKKFPVVTATIILINIVVYPFEPFLFLAFEGSDKLLLFGPGSLSPIGLITSIFLHQSTFHIIFNMIYLWAFGPSVEQRVGKKLFLLYYLGAGVAANILEAAVLLLFDPASKTLGLGASGAISGVMALYVYRCWFSKVKMVLNPLWLPFAVNVPAAPVILFWFFQNVLSAATIPVEHHRVGYLAHIGGFLFGLVVSRAKRYGHEGSVEYYSTKVESELKEGRGWKDVRSEESLLDLVQADPDEPAHRVKLAQYYTAKGETTKASAAYREAISRQFSTNPLFGAFTVLEHYDALGIACPLEYHTRAAGVFADYPDHLPEAQRVLEQALGSATAGAMAEKAHILYLKVCREMGDADRVVNGIQGFKLLFPKSRDLSVVESIPAMQPGTIFTKKKLALPESYVRTVEGDEKISKFGAWASREIHLNMGMIASPLFMFFWLAVYMVLYAMLSGFIGENPITGFIAQFLSFCFVATWFVVQRYKREEWSWRHKVTEKQERAARDDYDLAQLKNKATMSDRCEDYMKAAELYEKVLALDAGDIQARFRLAKIYQQKMKVRENEIRHFKVLLVQLPPGHPYHFEAEQAIANKAGYP